MTHWANKIRATLKIYFKNLVDMAMGGGLPEHSTNASQGMAVYLNTVLVFIV